MRGKSKPKKSTGGIATKDKLFKNDGNNFVLRFFNRGYYMFAIVKKFTFKILWIGSCLSLMFLMPAIFETLTEQEAVLDKIQRDDMLAQAADMDGFNPQAGAGQ